MARPVTVHVVTPVLNAVATIDETITSVISQAGDFKLVYHVHDGGSTDGTVERLAVWQAFLSKPNPVVRCKELHFSFAQAPDWGLYDAVVKAFAALPMAPEDFMTWLNGDDILFPGTIATLCAIEDDLPGEVEWITGPVTAIAENSGHRLCDHVAFPRNILQHGLADIRTWHFVQQEGVFWRRRLYDKAGGIDSRLRLAGDFDLWRRFARHAELVHAPVPLGAFRRRESQLSRDQSGYFKEIDSLVDPGKKESNLLQILDEALRGMPPRAVFLVYDDSQSRYLMKKRPVTYFPRAFDKRTRIMTTYAESPTVSTPVLNFSLLAWFYKLLPASVRLWLTRIKYEKILKTKPPLSLEEVCRIIGQSHLFLPMYYLLHNPDVNQAGLDPLKHYVLFGAKEGRKPNPLFDSCFYLNRYKDVAEAGFNPLYHYIIFGAQEGRDPSAEFSSRGYLASYPDVVEAKMNPLYHFLHHGAEEGRRPR